MPAAANRAYRRAFSLQSIFNSPMDKIWGTPGINANAFTIAVALFGASALVFGNWIERNGPFWTVNRTLWLTPAGWALCALGSWLPNYGVVYLGQLLHGMGAGHAYISLCSCAQRWFPEFKGFATGLAVMFFGVGSFIWTSIGRTLLDPKGDYKMLSYQVQGIFAGVYFGAIALSLPFLRNPPPDFTPDTAEIAKQQNCAGACLRTFAGKSKHVNATDRQFRFLEAVLQPEFVRVPGCAALPSLRLLLSSRSHTSLLPAPRSLRRALLLCRASSVYSYSANSSLVWCSCPLRATW